MSSDVFYQIPSRKKRIKRDTSETLWQGMNGFGGKGGGCMGVSELGMSWTLGKPQLHSKYAKRRTA